MTDTKILLSNTTSLEEKLNSAKHMIETYNLPLTQEEIMRCFTKARNSINSEGISISYYSRYKFIFDTLLNNNKYMFIAIIKTCIYGDIFNKFHISILEDNYIRPFNIGCKYVSTINVYRALLKYYDFNVDNLIMPEEYRLEIQQYRNEKYSGKLTKAAIKN